MFNTTNKLIQLQHDSAKALGIFQETINKLTANNRAIDAEIVVRDERIDKEILERETLNSLRKNNGVFIDKVNDFLTV